jgi:hypothetical protein
VTRVSRIPNDRRARKVGPSRQTPAKRRSDRMIKRLADRELLQRDCLHRVKLSCIFRIRGKIAAD